MIGKVEAYCKQNKLFKPGDSIVIACSGGPDSLALADVLQRLQAGWNLRLCVAHFEHGIRGEASRADAAFVREFAAQRGLPFSLESADVPAWAKQHRQSVETAARELRYAFLRRVSCSMGGAVIATAHHADDQAETVLMHILRGTGTEGLAAMRPRREDIIRPFLGITRTAIEQYCAARGLQPRHDATNDVPDCRRNRLRLELLPQLRSSYNPALTAALCQLAEIATGEDEFLQQAAAAYRPAVVQQASFGMPVLAAGPFAAMPTALQRVLLRQILQALPSGRSVSFSQLEELRELLLAGHTGQLLQLPGRLQAERSYGKVLFSVPTAAAKPAGFGPVQLRIPGTTELPQAGIVVRARMLEQRPALGGPHEICLDLVQLRLPLVVRSRQPGDRIALGGGHKKLKEFFIDAKVPQAVRDTVPVFCDAEEILWLGGLRQLQRGRVRADTRSFLHLSYTGRINNEK